MSPILLAEQVLNGLQSGVMLFLMAAGLTLIFGVMGLINLAHGSLYMIGAFAAATVAGFLASESLGHGSPGHDLVHTHRDFMLGATALSIGLTGVGWWMRAGGRAWKTGLSVAAVALVGVMSLGADRGAYLVYQHGVGVADGSSHQAPHSH